MTPISHTNQIEDRFDGPVEEAAESQREGEAGIVPAGLDAVDGLTGHSQPIRQIGLRPVSLRTQHLEAVLHAYRGRAIAMAMKWKSGSLAQAW
jgi:hypothetical protein